MISKIVVDSCVFTKLFLDEGDKLKALDLFQKLVADKTLILVPEIFIYEVFSVAVKEGASFDRVSLVLNKQKANNLQVVGLSEALIQEALKIIENNSHPKSDFPSFYDAVYRALAITNDCPFLTADKKHYEKTKKAGFIELF